MTSPSAVAVLDARALNRALLARQLLLEYVDAPVTQTLERLVGLQAQEPLEPYVGLWSRLRNFEPCELADLLTNRSVVRTLLMRRTLHFVSAEDCLALRPLHQPILVQRMLGTLRRRLPGVDLDELTVAAVPLFAHQPRRLIDVARAVGQRWAHVASRDLGDASACSSHSSRCPRAACGSPRGTSPEHDRRGMAGSRATGATDGHRGARGALPARLRTRSDG